MVTNFESSSNDSTPHQNMLLNGPSADQALDVQNAIAKAKMKVAPLWDTRDYVAVNPLFGYRSESFYESLAKVYGLTGVVLLPDQKFFRTQFELGKITEQHLLRELTFLKMAKAGPFIENLDLLQLTDFIKSDQSKYPTDIQIKSISDIYDLENGTAFTNVITNEVSKWLSSFFDEGQAVWKMPGREHGLFQAWKKLIRFESDTKLFHPKLKSLAKNLPNNSEDAVHLMYSIIAQKISLSEDQLADYFLRLFVSVQGWASYLQKLESETTTSDNQRFEPTKPLTDLLAIRLAYDLSLFEAQIHRVQLASWERDSQELESALTLGLIWLRAYESSIRDNILSKLNRSPLIGTPVRRPLAQFAFCIDVRSEVVRRHLEKNSEVVQTIGFAGFFGLPISLKRLGFSGTDPQCPVLIKPSLVVEETAKDSESTSQNRRRKVLNRVDLKHAQSSINSAFSLAEVFGIAYAAQLLKCNEGVEKPNLQIEQDDEEVYLDLEKMDMKTKVFLAQNALTNMSLTSQFAKYIFFFGHGGESANNPYEAALNCGACAGHNGRFNAQLLADILNDQTVRAQLIEDGIAIPEDTRFIPGWHNTTQDILIVDKLSHQISDPEDYKALKALLNLTQFQCRSERAKYLGGNQMVQTNTVDEEMHLRANDWSEVRPEWALARNHSFIVGRRALSRGLDLEGRSFLHDYDESRDPELKILELIMTAPMIVTNWINMQYYASTIDTEKFGSGNKILNNVVGTIGCVQGNESDLLGGLSEQSVRYQGNYFHEPVRLQVFIEAKTASIDEVIKRHPMVADLVRNEWLYIVAIVPQTNEVQLLQKDTWSVMGKEISERYTH